MRRLCLALALPLLFVAPARADDIDDRLDLCSDKRAALERRLQACDWFLNSGRLDASQASFIYFLRGAAYIHNDRDDEALADLAKALQLNPDNTEAYVARAIVHGRHRRFDEAIADLDRAVRIEPDHAVAYYSRALAHRGKDETDRALADFDKAIALRPDYAAAYAERGNLLDALRRYDRALADFKTALRIQPGLAAALAGRGDVHFKTGRYRLALADYDRALAIEPDNAIYVKAKAWLWATANSAQFRDGREAVRIARRAVALSEDGGTVLVLAAAYVEAGRPDDAFDAYRRAMRLERGYIRGFQGDLKLQGYYKGPVDGDFGAGSLRALMACVRDGCKLLAD